eukprot:GHVL01020468.1.p1 GENE.GHVL01020468.1~~GHVL01020468.1.p1  ORF type:complete len:618 (+),score=147.91 GHVL01020468.1:95-1948(+)
MEVSKCFFLFFFLFKNIFSFFQNSTFLQVLEKYKCEIQSNIRRLSENSKERQKLEFYILAADELSLEKEKFYKIDNLSTDKEKIVKIKDLVTSLGGALFKKYKKQFHEDTLRQARSDRLIIKKKEKIIPNKKMGKFGPFDLSPTTVSFLSGRGICEPCPIQLASGSDIYAGLSCIIHEQTGGGKTLAALIPLVERMKRFSKKPLNILVLAPTRDLCIQLAREIIELTDDRSAVSLFVDHEDLESDIVQCKSPFVIGTPKFIVSALENTSSSPGVLSQIKVVVIDEIDQILKPLKNYPTMKDKVNRIKHPPLGGVLVKAIFSSALTRTNHRPGNLLPVQIIGLSATVNRKVQSELTKCMTVTMLDVPRIIRPLGVDIRPPLGADVVSSINSITIPKTVDNRILPINKLTFFSKIQAAVSLLRYLKPAKPLIFIPKEHSVKTAILYLHKLGIWDALPYYELLGFSKMDSNISDNGTSDHISLRNNIDLLYRSCNETSVNILADDKNLIPTSVIPPIVTSLSSIRGLDLYNVDLIIILGSANHMTDYIHAAGRTGRANCNGRCVTVDHFTYLKKLIRWTKNLKINFNFQEIDSDDPLYTGRDEFYEFIKKNKNETEFSND